MLKNFIFDMDGTLVDSKYDIRRYLLDGFRQNGVHIDDSTFIQIGPPLERIIRNTAPHISDELADKVLISYRRLYINGDLSKTIPFDGIIDALKYIKSQNLNAFIATFKPFTSAQQILNNHFIGLYKDIITPTEIKNFNFRAKISKADMLNFFIDKWRIKPQESAMIGDAKSDIDGAKEAGMTAIAALYGYGQPDEFDNADFKVKTARDLFEIIKKMSKE
ncbi:MAG: HAD hydrolase-like protein [Elusimicrobiota bacterium]|jgi:phosphoglycolate phosphatase|nr:HAD hydrolase-like protein [Elusimicrobiota bacterium]